MDMISMMAGSFLNLMVGCDAQPVIVMRVRAQDYQIQSWVCTDKHEAKHLWRTWQLECTAQNGATFWSRPYFLEEQGEDVAYYVNRFGEVQGGRGASIEQAYVPLCGS